MLEELLPLWGGWGTAVAVALGWVFSGHRRLRDRDAVYVQSSCSCGETTLFRRSDSDGYDAEKQLGKSVWDCCRRALCTECHRVVGIRPQSAVSPSVSLCDECYGKLKDRAKFAP